MNLLTIFVFVLIILLIYTVYKLMTRTTVSVSGFTDASKSLSVDSSKYGANSTSNFGYSAWLYVDAWSTSAAAEADIVNKNILTRSSNNNQILFQMALDNDQNNLTVVIPDNKNPPCTIRNVQLQKWINLTMSVYGNTLDLYLDGKLVRTCIMTSPITSLSSSDVLYVGGGYDAKSQKFQDGDLQGYISNVVYKGTYFTPEEAWDIYSAGYSGSGMFDFINKYKLNFSITKNNQTVGEISV
jgi:hypothetical protein